MEQTFSKKRCYSCGTEYPATAEFFYKNRSKADGLTEDCKACRKEKTRQYRADNPDKIKEQTHRYYEANGEKVREANSRYRKANPEKIKQINRRWYTTNVDKLVENNRRHNARKRALPNAFTERDRKRALEYWRGCCAVCGRPLHDLFNERIPVMDHWIPVTDVRPDNPGTVPWNLVPLCHGINGCNNSKNDRDPMEWLNDKFGARRAKHIEKSIEDFFAWTKSD